MSFSLNNKLILETYKTDRGLRSNTSGGFAMPDQKVKVHGLKLLMDAQITMGTNIRHVRAGSKVYIKEELLHTQPWAQKILESDAIEGKFIIVGLEHVDFIVPKEDERKEEKGD